jgi:TRAP-type C4-dicarboxylate transport system permease small subunit
LIRKVWDNVEEGALCLLLFFMVTITFVTVVTRYVFDFPLSYIDALILLGCGAFFLGTAVYGAKIVSMQMENRLMASLGYPSWFVGLAVPVGSVLFVVRAVEAWVRHRRND